MGGILCLSVCLSVLYPVSLKEGGLNAIWEVLVSMLLRDFNFILYLPLHINPKRNRLTFSAKQLVKQTLSTWHKYLYNYE